MYLKFFWEIALWCEICYTGTENSRLRKSIQKGSSRMKRQIWIFNIKISKVKVELEVQIIFAFQKDRKLRKIKEYLCQAFHEVL